MNWPTWTSPDGRVRLINADCLEVLPQIEAGSVDAVVTDPPYGVGFKYDGHDDTRDGYEEWCGKWFDECVRIAPTVLMSCGAVNVQMWARIRPFSWQIAWLKPAAMGRSPVGFCNWEPMVLWGSGSGESVDVFTAPIVPDDSIGWHPCPKPLKWGIESVKRAVKAGGLVCDPFMGSGTTAIACYQTDRRYIGIEKDPAYFAKICERVQGEYESTPLFPEYARTELFNAQEAIA